MASTRTGKFGIQPRVAQSLTSVLADIARQFQQQRDQNLMDAWMKGGTFEGRKATDAMVLAHWKSRMGDVSKDDPMYDTYKNAHTQLDYNIHESKMTAAYALHKTSDAAMVSFYLGWAKKVPKDSEFYRVLQRDAGQYMRTQRTNSEAEKRKAAELKYQSEQAATRKGKEAAGEYIIDTLRRVAQSGYADGGITAAISAPGSNSDLTDFDPTDPETMLRLLNVITPGTGPHLGATANKSVIFHDDDKKGVTGQDIMSQLGKLDPSWSPGQPLDVGYITGVLDTQVKGLNERIARATKTGHVQDATELGKSKSYVAMLNREVGAWPVQKAYNDLRATRDAVVNDPTASPAAVLKAQDAYAASLVELSKSPNIAADDNMRSRLVGEAKGEDGAPTLYESFTGLQNGAFDPSSAKDSANTQAHMDYLREQVDAVATGAAVWTYGTTGSNGVFVPQAGGKEVGAAPREAVAAGGAMPTTITVPDPAGGLPMQVMVTATPIYATAKDPVTGNYLQQANKNPIGYAYDVTSGGKVTTSYGFTAKGPDGQFTQVFSQDPPWDTSLPVTASSTGGNHLEVDLTKVYADANKVTRNPDGTLSGTGIATNVNGAVPNMPGFSVVGYEPPGPKGGDAKPGTVIFDPFVAATGTDPTRQGTFDPHTDFTSLTLSTLTQSTDGDSILKNLDSNPAFKSQLDQDNLKYAGANYDPASGQYLQDGSGDPNRLASSNSQVAYITAPSDPRLGPGADRAFMWTRDFTGSPFPGGASTAPAGSGGPGGQAPVNQLPSDLIVGSDWAALGNAFVPGQNNLKSDMGGDKAGLNIKTVGTIKVPGSPLIGLQPTPKPLQGVVASTTGAYVPPPGQTGSQAPGGTSPQGGGSGSKPPSGGSNPIYGGGQRL